MKLPSTSPFPSGRVSSRSLDEEEEAMQRHAYMSSRAPERLPAATRTNWYVSYTKMCATSSPIWTVIRSYLLF